MGTLSVSILALRDRLSRHDRVTLRVSLRVRRRKPGCGLSMKALFPTSQGGSLNLPEPHLNQWVDLGLSGSVKSNAIVAQHDPASETN